MAACDLCILLGKYVINRIYIKFITFAKKKIIITNKTQFLITE